MAPVAWGYSSGAPICTYPSAGWTSMGGGVAGTGGFVIRVLDRTGPITQYSPGKTYAVEVSDSTAYAGFLLQSVKGIPGNANVDGVGVFAWSDSTLYHHAPCGTAASSVTHTYARTIARLRADTFRWSAPPAGTGPVTFHLVGVVSRFEWYGRGVLITTSLLEGGDPIESLAWSRIKSLYR